MERIESHQDKGRLVLKFEVTVVYKYLYEMRKIYLYTST